MKLFFVCQAKLKGRAEKKKENMTFFERGGGGGEGFLGVICFGLFFFY